MKMEMDDNTKTVIFKLLEHIFTTGASFSLKIDYRPDLSTKDSNKFKIVLDVK